jgi:FlaG/FlaF family flagellin (archaellin)
MERLKGISEMISIIILIGVVVVMAVVVGPWAMKLASKTAEGTEENVNQELICRGVAYAFDTDYGVSGVLWNFTDTKGTISAKIINTGTQNLYNFSFELTMQTETGIRMIIYPEVNVTAETQRTKNNPLKPGYEWILEADVENINSTWSLLKVKVINDVCPKISPYVEF